MRSITQRHGGGQEQDVSTSELKEIVALYERGAATEAAGSVVVRFEPHASNAYSLCPCWEI